MFEKIQILVLIKTENVSSKSQKNANALMKMVNAFRKYENSSSEWLVDGWLSHYLIWDFIWYFLCGKCSGSLPERDATLFCHPCSQNMRGRGSIFPQPLGFRRPQLWKRQYLFSWIPIWISDNFVHFIKTLHWYLFIMYIHSKYKNLLWDYNVLKGHSNHGLDARHSPYQWRHSFEAICIVIC